MTEIALSPTSAKQVWRKNVITEYVRQSRFLPFMGSGSSTATEKASTGPMPIIQVFRELEGQPGNVINVPLVTRLKGQGVSGGQILVGNEDDLGNYNAQIGTDWVRNGLVVPKNVSYKTEIDLWNIGKRQLGTWSAEKLRDNLLQSMASVIVTGLPFTDPTTSLVTIGPDQAVNYANATSAQLNTYLANNIDRILFGANISNSSSGVWATALGNIDTTNDRASTGMFSLAKRMAKKAGSGTSALPHIRPYMVPESGREYFVAFCATNTFRDIQNDAAMIEANRTARAREGSGMSKNPLFQDGDLEYNGVIYIEFPELDQLTVIGGGAAGSNVDMNFMCGQQAIGLAYTSLMNYVIDKQRDYQFRPGVAVEECRGQKKLSFNGTMLGVIPVLTSSVGDV